MSLPRELARKALHVSTAVVPVAYAAGLDRGFVSGVLLALLAIAIVVEVARRSAGGARVFSRYTGLLLREHEHAGAWAGATWLLLAFVVAVLAFPREVAVAAMLGVSLGDAAGAVVGRWWSERGTARDARDTRGAHAAVGTPAGAGGPPQLQHASEHGAEHHPLRARSIEGPPSGVAPAPPGIPSRAKTWAGTVACALATALGALLVARLSVAESVLAGVLAAAAERPRIRFDDNLRIVLAVAIGILLCRLAFS